MASKAVKAVVRLIVPAAQAKPSPQIGQALGSLGVNMMQFCKDFNAKTVSFKDGIPLRVQLTARQDSSFDFEVSSPRTSWFLKQAAGLGGEEDKASSTPGYAVAGQVHIKQIYEIARIKQSEMEGNGARIQPLDSVCKSIMGTAKSMGLAVVRD
eukprot:TRINITY_DN67142_c7_g8_i1.p1 TRINITY_DN67142_c7_g8~~TRINITY_DN67142_c7_g8_i1.p1  ORF type:complete len:154 (+),score=73.90 TRINITY_DN67142_c7_g8_i1:66-527(+)